MIPLYWTNPELKIYADTVATRLSENW